MAASPLVCYHRPNSPPQQLMAKASLGSIHKTTTRLAASPAFHVSSTAEPMAHHHHPSLEILGGAKESFLPALPSLTRPYTPFPVFGWNRHVETIFAAFFRSTPDIKLRRECLRTKDDGSVSLDWVPGDDRVLPADSPLLILLPGLTGGSDDSYVRHMLIRARNRGWRVVVFNSRGCGGSPVTTPQEIYMR